MSEQLFMVAAFEASGPIVVDKVKVWLKVYVFDTRLYFSEMLSTYFEISFNPASMMERPFSNCSSVMTNGVRTRTTLP